MKGLRNQREVCRWGLERTPSPQRMPYGVTLITPSAPLPTSTKEWVTKG
jgi:hypothetical protein